MADNEEIVVNEVIENQQAAAVVDDFDINLGLQEAAPIVETPADAAPTITPQDWKEVIKGKTKEEVLAAIGHTEEDYDDFIKELHKHRKNGGDTTEYLFHKTKDWDKENDIDLLEAKIQRENPTLTKEEVQELLLDTYSFMEGDEQKQKEVKIKADAAKEREQMKELQKKFAIKEAEPKQTQEQPQSQAQVTTEDVKTQLVSNAVIKSMIENKKVVIPIEGIGNMNFAVPNTDDVLNFMAGDVAAFEKYRHKGGQPDLQTETLAHLMYMVGADKFINAIANYAAGKKQDKIIEQASNIGREQAPTPVGGGSTTSNVRFEIN